MCGEYIGVLVSAEGLTFDSSLDELLAQVDGKFHDDAVVGMGRSRNIPQASCLKYALG